MRMLRPIPGDDAAARRAGGARATPACREGGRPASRTGKAVVRRGAVLLVALATAVAGPVAGEGRRSGFDDLSRDIQALQRDDTLNPAWLWVQEGRRLWERAAPPGGGRSCAGCHGDAGASMGGVAARYPAFDAATGGPLDLGGRIAACRMRHQQAEAVAPDDEDTLALEAFVASLSRGRPIAPPADDRLAPFRARGGQLYRQRQGQLDLSCAHCHERHADARLAGSRITQGQATGYPVYRLEWQGLGSLQRRLRNCLAGVRAEVPPAGHADLIALELHLAERAAGLPFEAPAVRP